MHVEPAADLLERTCLRIAASMSSIRPSCVSTWPQSEVVRANVFEDSPYLLHGLWPNHQQQQQQQCERQCERQCEPQSEVIRADMSEDSPHLLRGP